MLIQILHFLLIILFGLGVILYITCLLNQMVYKVPHVSTFNSDLSIIRKVFSKYITPGRNVADLGSGTGKILRLLEKEFGAKTTGYEIDLSNVIISKILNKIYKSEAKVAKGNYLEANLQEHGIIYIYLFPCLMEKVEERIFSHCTKGTIVIVNAFPFKNHKPLETFKKKGKGKIFIYRV